MAPGAVPGEAALAEAPRALPAVGGLSEARAARLLEERAARLAARHSRVAGAAVAPAALPPILACALGRECYGLPLERLLAVQPATALVGLPVMSPPLLGFFARAGQPYAVLDLAAMLGLPPALPPAPPPAGRGVDGPAGHLLLLRGEPGRGALRVALRVDRALGVVTPQPLAAPSGGRDDRAAAIAGRGLVPAGPLGPREMVLGLLDPERLLQPFLSATSAAGA
ncbi:chemotaxis protein CheW [Roseomonas gilardii subsp. gilardii]|uniref:chemotaxis protein CheW n=1 Tax=Roseomonas gilardii TaxID=257708 RepID=UPI001FFC04E3|nr:chemotaxis protein CheW [Roseomonas gilardii]UPG73413.1 chemotaxis protein CheW [Roseomonas gilardii subsp. gilardii]